MAATGQGGVREKKLLTDFTGSQPRYEFTGNWTGKDIRIVLTHARRAYFLHNKALRAQRVEPATEEEASDVVNQPKTQARKKETVNA
jgi:hypothetical protein